MLELKPGPDQANVAPGVVEEPISTRFGSPQDTWPPVAAAVGAVVLPVTEAVAVEVQPLDGLVTTTVYVPAVSTVGFCWFELNPGPVQAYVTPGVGEFPLIVTAGVTQLITAPVALAEGGVLFSETVVVAVAVQLFARFVIVTVYVPAATTLDGFCTDELKPPGPLQA